MLVDFRVQNFRSFNTEQEFSMVASTSTKENFNTQNTIEVNKFGIKNVLKSAAIFGANASGKTNLLLALQCLQEILKNSLNKTSNTLEKVTPFLLQDSPHEQDTELEVSFIANDKLFRYGICINQNKIKEEWLYWTENARETLLFSRKQQTVEFNKRSFSEAKDFVTKQGDEFIIEKTKPHIPFVTVLSQFDGEKSNMVVGWITTLFPIFSSSKDASFNKLLTFSFFEQSSEFNEWATNVLKSIQIDGIELINEESLSGFQEATQDIKERETLLVARRLEELAEKNFQSQNNIRVIKKSHSTEQPFSLPFTLESEGTKQLIEMLGPIYLTIKQNAILIIDEFDSKFHTLLSEFFIKLFHQHNNSKGQLIITTHDTNLLNKALYRRDQIWFVDKSEQSASELFSLVEYKEHYTRRDDSYSKDYLAGKYGAIPLFNDVKPLEDLLDD